MFMLPKCSCCGSCEPCCRDKTYSYMDTEPKGKWYDECPEVGQCGGAAGSCANEVLDGFIIERFCKSILEGKLIKATLKKGSSVDDFGTIAGIATDVQCGQLGKITSAHDITDQVVFEDDPDDSDFLLAKVPFQAVNANHGGPYGLAHVMICWCCVEDVAEPPPCDECCPPLVCTETFGTSGGAGTTTNTYTFPDAALDLEFIWEAYTVPDAFTVKFCGNTVVDTGSVSGSGKRCLQKPEGCSEIEVTVVGPSGTVWGYTIKCQCGPPPPPRYGCREGQCVKMPGGPYDDPTCGGACDEVGPCCTPYGLVYVKRSVCATYQGEFYEPGEDFDATCGCDCNVGGEYCFDNHVPLNADCTAAGPADPLTHCGPGPEFGGETDYYPFSRTLLGGPTGYFCEDGDCSPLDDLIAKGARIIGWFDNAFETKTEANAECCLGFASGDRYEYRVFAYNCKLKVWEAAPNVMAFANSFSVGNNAGAACTTGPAPIVAPGPTAPVRSQTGPTCKPVVAGMNPLP